MSLLYSTPDNRGALAPLNGTRSGDPAWDDAQVTATAATGAGALATVTFRDTGLPLLAMASNADDTLGFITQFPHRWNKGQVRPHIHWIPLAAPAAARTVRFTGVYAWSTIGVEVPAVVGWTTFTVDVAVLPGDENKQKITSIAQITPPAWARVESAHLLVKLTRNGLAAADDYVDGAAGNVGILSLDTHYQSEKLGTFDEIPEP